MGDIKINVPKGTTKNRKVIGRGPGSGHGGTATKGHKGQNARSGGGVRPGFEGGQMPLYRRIARRGFSNHMFKNFYNVINLRELDKFEDGSTINRETLIEKRLLKKKGLPVKILGDGEVTKKFVVEVEMASKSAKEKIEKAGGQLILKAEVQDNG